MDFFLCVVGDLEGVGRKYLPMTGRVKKRENSIFILHYCQFYLTKAHERVKKVKSIKYSVVKILHRTLMVRV